MIRRLNLHAPQFRVLGLTRLCLSSLGALSLLASPAYAQVAKPAAIVADGLPPVPEDLAAATLPYLESRRAQFLGWQEADGSMLIGTRFGTTQQLHSVAAPNGARRQITFEAEPVSGLPSPAGDVISVIRDKGGDEFYQIYTLNEGRLTLITDGKSRNQFGTWSPDGKLIGYASTRRTGADADLYLVDPRHPESDRMVAQVSGGGWSFQDISQDNRRGLISRYISVTRGSAHELDLATGRMTQLSPQTSQAFYGSLKYGRDGRVWVLSDEGADQLRLGRLEGGRFVPVTTEPRWEVSSYDLSPDGRYVAYAINEAGAERLRIMEIATGTIRDVSDLPVGVLASGLSFGLASEEAPWGKLGFSISSATIAGDAFSVDPKTLAVTRWTYSETGGLDASQNVSPRLIEVASFDGEPISGFLYQPDPAKFPGPRPMIMRIHGGPEGQSQPGYRGSDNYLINELGVAVFFPNVRGSTGYGTRFVSLDNGPFKREDSVKDIEAFLNHLAGLPALDKTRFGVSGGSYGGYMCYAAAVQFGDRLRGAACVVAISNFVTFLENTQSYRRDLRRVEYGDERDPVQRAKLEAISPLTRVNEIKIPIMVTTGGNDPRVPASEADQMVRAIRANGGTAWHLLAENEGHGLSKKENADYNFWTSLLFWQQTLLADTQP